MTGDYEDLLHQLGKERSKVERRVATLEFSIGQQIGWRDLMRETKQPFDKIEKAIGSSQLVLLELSKLAAFYRATETRVRELLTHEASSTERR